MLFNQVFCYLPALVSYENWLAAADASALARVWYVVYTLYCC